MDTNRWYSHLGTGCVRRGRASRPPLVKVEQSLYSPGQVWGFWGVGAPRFQDNQHMMVVSLSAPCISLLYPPGNIPGTHFC